MSNRHDENSHRIEQWLQRRSEGCLDNVLASIVTGIVGGLAITQLPTLRTSPDFFLAAIIFVLLSIIAVWRYRTSILHLFIRPKPFQKTYHLIPPAGPPLSNPRNFYGRSKQCREFFECITAPEVLSVSILGVRRSGKTSFLNYITHPTILTKYLNRNRSRYIFAFLDLEDGNIRSQDDFYSKAIACMCKESTHLPHPPSAPGRIGYPADDFADLVHTISRDKIRIIFLLDEFERLLSLNGFDEAFFMHLRSLVVHGNVGWVITSHRPLHELLSRFDMPISSPFFNIFHIPPLHLGVLEDAPCMDLMRKSFDDQGLICSEQEGKFIRSLAGGLPFWIQVAVGLYLKHREENDFLDQAILEQTVGHAFFLGMHPHFKHTWDQLSKDEKQTLRTLVTDFSRRDNRKRAFGRQPYLSDLQKYGLVEPVGKDFKLGSSAFGLWITQQARIRD